MTTNEEMLKALRIELADCLAEARRHGLEGEAWEPTDLDIDSVQRACRARVGRAPTREEMAQAIKEVLR